MIQTKLIWALTGLGSLAACAFVALVAAADDIPSSEQPIFNPQNPTKAARRKDPTKRMVELPAKAIVAAKSAGVSAGSGTGFVNPKVQPGAVRWHADFAAAKAASAKSKKPVFLFQMLGRLDEKFC